MTINEIEKMCLEVMKHNPPPPQNTLYVDAVSAPLAFRLAKSLRIAIEALSRRQDGSDDNGVADEALTQINEVFNDHGLK